MVRLGLALALASTALWTACSAPPVSRTGLDSVLLITVDTLRADHVSCYGGKVDTPNFDALAAAGARVERAWSTVPLTTPAHASILTGLYPPSHGLRNNARFRLPDDVETLAELMGERGRETAAFVSAFTTSGRFGLSQGFDVYDDDLGMSPRGTALTQRRGDLTVERALRWLADNDDRPFLLWVHLFDPHTPYSPPREFQRAYPSDGYSGEVAFADAQVGRLLDALAAGPAAKRTAVALLADHGEGLGTHGELEHGVLLYEESVHVPMIFSAPGLIEPGTVIQTRASLVDVIATLAPLVDLPVADEVQGIDLMDPTPRPERQVYAETLYPYEEYRWSSLHALLEADTKLIEAPVPELFDLDADPREGTNLAAERPEDLKRMRRALTDKVAAMTNEARLAAAAGFGAVDDETIARLESLGYAAGGQTLDGAPEGSGVITGGRNPRDAMVDLQRFQRAQQLSKAGQQQAAIQLLEDLAESDADNPQVLMKLGLALEKVDKNAEAEARYWQLIETHPTFLLGYRRLSDLLEQQERWDEARLLWLRLRGVVPGYVGTETRLAQVEIGAGRADEAARRLESLVEEHPSADAWSLLGLARHRLGAHDEAIGAYERALESSLSQRRAIDGMLDVLAETDPDRVDAFVERLVQQAPQDPYIRQLAAERRR